MCEVDYPSYFDELKDDVSQMKSKLPSIESDEFQKVDTYCVLLEFEIHGRLGDEKKMQVILQNCR